MFWVIVCTVLAAAGLFAAGWALFGWCVLPQRREAVTVYRLQACEPQLERQVRAFVWARESGLAAVRADTHRGNRAMRRFLEKSGFAECGLVVYQTAAGDPLRVAYDLVIG